MEFSGTRRKLNTYGKANRKVLVHDIFGLDTQSYQYTPAVSNLRAPDKSRPSKAVDTPQLQNKRMVSDTTSDASAVRDERKSATPSSASTSAHSSSREKSPSSLFEIQSSDDDSKVKARRPLKKRKLVSTTADTTDGAQTRTREKQATHRSHSDTRILQRKALRQPVESEIVAGRPARSLHSGVMRTDPKPRKQIPRVKSTGQQPSELNESRPGTRAEPQVVLPGTRPSPNRTLHASRDSSTHLSDDSNVIPSSRPSTPTRKRLVGNNGVADSPSPSELQMTSLKLTSDTILQDLQVSSDDEEMTEASRAILPPPRARKRLVDRLDAPASRNVDNMTSKSLQPGRTSKPSSQPVSGTTSPGKAGTAPPLMRTGTAPLSTSNVAPSGRARATYARQRSYLSDMVDSLESQPGSLSQPSSQQDYLSQLSFAPSGSQMELVHEDSDDDDFTQIKSIHELRRGGAIRKFDLDLHTIVEDIEAESRSLRIQALIQLNRKLEDLNLCRHFQESSTFVRFLECAKDGLDDVSATLMVFAFRRMLGAESSSPKSCLQMFSALEQLPMHLISERRSLSKLAKDRSQNLSKLLIKDVTNFDEHLVEHDKQSSTGVNSALIETIDGLLRSLIRLKEPLPQRSAALLDAIVGALISTEEEMQDHEGADNHVTTLQQLLSILEVTCAKQELLASSMSASRVSELGDSIAGILVRARRGQLLVEQSCLRFIVTLSNNEPKVCSALAERRLIVTVFEVVEDHFSTLAGLAAREEDVDTAQLDSVILAIGCLLNLAECADAAREQMLDLGTGGRSLVDRLVDIFNSHVDQSSEAMTMQQTHVLVAFGYISALLCTLCLNSQARERISKSIKGEGLTELFGQADTFLNHLQTVEAALEDEGGSAAGFTARFTAVLESVKTGTNE